MIRLTLAQMRRSRGRLTAGGLAIAISTAFVTVTLLAGGVLTATAQGAITASYGDADLLIQGWPITDETVAAVAATDGVAVVEPRFSTVVQMVGPEGVLWVDVAAPPTDSRLQAHALLEGSLPGRGGIALPDGIAATLGVGVGSTVNVAVSRYVEGAGVTNDQYVERLEVAGILDGAAASFYGGSMTALAEPSDVRTWVRDQTYPGEEPTYRDLLVLVDDYADVAGVQASVIDSLSGRGDLVVRTPAEQAAVVIQETTGEANTLTALALAFGGVALLVAALVISNTFQVLVAQRTRTLALLRCVGADRAQLRRSVISEAMVLGGVATVTGIGFGTAAVQATLMIIGQARPHLPLPTLAPVTVASVVVPLVIGVLVTVVAALGPARTATRVSPLAALRPADSRGADTRANLVRAWAAILVTLGGSALLALGVVMSQVGAISIGLGVAVLGGAVSFVGLLIGGVFWLPRLVGVATRALGRLGRPSARLAAANSTRNPRRVVATSTALLIGVTLVVMMATGAASARSAIAQRLDSEFPVDVEAYAMNSAGEFEALPAQFAETVRDLPGVAAVATLTASNVTVSREGTGVILDYQPVVGVDASATEVVRSAALLAPLEDGVVIVPRNLAELGIATGDTLLLTDASVPRAYVEGAPESDDTAAPEDRTLTVTAAVTDLPGWTLVLTRDSLAEVASAQAPSHLWVKVSDHRDADVVPAIQSAAATSAGTGIQVIGPVAERASWEGIVDSMLEIVLGLLAVSVVIALVGVANTLSLSVIERRRESATLRAIGLTRGQLRETLAWEGVVIALVGAVAGSVLGTVYGWLGAHTVLQQVGIVTFAVAWRELLLVLVVAVAAGLIASVLPSRSATRTSPVEALAVE